MRTVAETVECPECGSTTKSGGSATWYCEGEPGDPHEKREMVPRKPWHADPRTWIAISAFMLLGILLGLLAVHILPRWTG